MKADYERQAAELADVLARLNAERAELLNGVDKEHPALVAFAKYQSIETLTREILTDLVDHIKVYENGNISVHFKFADEFRKIAEYIEINTTDTAEAGWPPPKQKPFWQCVFLIGVNHKNISVFCKIRFICAPFIWNIIVAVIAYEHAWITVSCKHFFLCAA